MRTFVGTSGYSYKEWKGTFFPEDLPASKMLGFYAGRFNTVEINNTFYRMPAPAMVAKWAEQVPEAFVFALKAPQTITHRRQLNDAGDAVAFFWKTARELGPKLGPVLFQMPPFFKKDLGRLRDFLRQLPEDCRAAFEFRHPSWFADDVYDVLKTAGAPLCLADTDEEEPPLVATGNWGDTTQKGYVPGCSASVRSPGRAPTFSSSTKTKAKDRSSRRSSMRRCNRSCGGPRWARASLPLPAAWPAPRGLRGWSCRRWWPCPPRYREGAFA